MRDLYEKNELTSAINRVVEDINHRFTLDVLDRIDLAGVTKNLRQRLEIRNREEQTVKLREAHAAEIKEYLDLLDLTEDVDVLHFPTMKPVKE